MTTGKLVIGVFLEEIFAVRFHIAYKEYEFHVIQESPLKTYKITPQENFKKPSFRDYNTCLFNTFRVLYITYDWEYFVGANYLRIFIEEKVSTTNFFH